MQFNSTLLKGLLFGAICIVPHLNLFSQELIPRIDEVIHLNDVNELAVSPDYKYFALADSDGVVTFRDVETGKIIAQVDYDEDIEDIAFSNNEGCLIVVSSDYNDNDDLTYVEYFDFINEDSLSIYQFENLDVAGVDFSEKDNYVLIRPSKGKPQLIDYSTGNIFPIAVPEDISFGGFDADGNCIIYNGSENDTEVMVYEYKIATKELKLLRIIENIELVEDLNNKLIYRKGDQLVMVDLSTGVSISISGQEYKRDHSYNIFDFAFSPDGKYVTIVGGDGESVSRERTSYVVSQVSKGNGYVDLYNVNTGKKEWETTNQKNQPKLDIMDVDWISKTSFVVGDVKGNVFSMSIAENIYYSEFALPRKVITIADVSEDLSSIVYSQKGGPSFQFDIRDDGERKSISNKFSNMIQISSNNTIAATPPSIHLENPVNEYVLGLKKKFKLPEDIFQDVESMALSQSGSSFAIATAEKYTTMSGYSEQTVINVKNTSDGKIKKIEFENYFLVPLDNQQQEIFKQKLEENPSKFLVATEISTSVINFNNSKPYLIQGWRGDLQFSVDGKLLCVNPENDFNGLKIFDIENESWFHFRDEPTPLKYNYFSQKFPFALSIDLDSKSYVWNTETRQIIFSGSLELEGFEPNNPISAAPNSMTTELDRLVKNVSFTSDGAKVYIQLEGSLFLLDTRSGSFSKLYLADDFINSSISPDGMYIYTEEYDDQNQRSWARIKNFSENNFLYEKAFIECFDPEDDKILTGDVFFHKSKPLAFVHNAHGTFELVDLKNQELLATLKFFENGEWVVFSPNGLFDGSKYGRNAIYYTYGTEVILFNQIKEKFWQPDLLNLLINNPDLILTEGADSGLKLYPHADLSVGNTKGEVNVKLTGATDQVGVVSLFINDKEVEPDINLDRRTNMSFNVLDDKYRPYLFDDGTNEVSVMTYNKNGTISSRPFSLYFKSNLAKDKGTGVENELSETSRQSTISSSLSQPGLYGLFVGTSKYQNEKLNLSFADKDALDLKDAFDMISKQLYDQNRISLTALYSSAENADSIASKSNILKAFAKMEAEAKPNDIVVLFFSGHGLTIDDDFYYLTKTAGKTDLRADAEERVKTCLSSKEIKEGLKNIKSNKQIMILDACHSGQITKIFEATDKASSTSLNKALENLEDKTGVYVLASSESNQKSFETETLQQGLLTFSLKYGMSGEASQDDVLDVAELLTFASTNAEEIGKKILGKSQRPVLGITQGGNPFPIGTKNPELRVELPENKQKFSEPRFFVISNFSDPKKIEKAVKDDLMARGAIGSNSDFIYIKNELDIDAIKIAGSYKVEGTSINLEWNLIKQEEVFKGPLTLSIEEEDLDLIGKMVVKQSLKALN